MWWIHENRVYKLCDLWKALTHLFHYYDLTVGPYRKQNRQKHLSSHDTCYCCVPCLSFSVSQVVKVFFVFFSMYLWLPNPFSWIPLLSFQLANRHLHICIPWLLQNWHVHKHILSGRPLRMLNDTTAQQTPQEALLRPPPFPLPHILPIQPPKFLSAASPFLHPAMP